MEKSCINCGLEESLMENISTNITTKEIMCWDCNVHKNRYVDDEDKKEEIGMISKENVDKILSILAHQDAYIDAIYSALTPQQQLEVQVKYRRFFKKNEDLLSK
jgi:hypothetical protein